MLSGALRKKGAFANDFGEEHQATARQFASKIAAEPRELADVGFHHVTPEETVSARTIFRDAGIGVYAAYRQSVRRGTDMYIILGDPDPDHTGLAPRLAVKMVRVF